MNRRTYPSSFPPQADETDDWGTAAWSAEDVKAVQAAQARQEKGNAKPAPHRKGPCQQPSPQQSDGKPIASKAKQARPEKRVPSVRDVIHQRRERIDQKRTIRAFLLKLIVIVGLGYALLTYVFGFAVMEGEQMYPRIRDGDLMFYYRLEDSYSIGDVVTFVRSNTRYTGRVVAKEGDKVALDEAGLFRVNDNVQTEEIFYPTTVTEDSNVPFPLQIGANSLFLLCDMRTNAIDSRNYGQVRLDELDGKVITLLRRRGI